MKKTRTTILTAAGAACMLMTAPGCGSDSSNEPPDQDAGTDTGTGVDTGAADHGPPPVPVDVVAAGVRWIGRVDTTTDAAHPRFSWSGTGFVAKFMGTSLSAQLTVTGAASIFKTVIDGAPQPTFTAAAGTNTFPLAMGLTSDVHTVELYRQTEGPQGETRLMGLTTDGTLMDPPPGPGRLIEVIGDSISCGYGLLGKNSDTECFTTEDHWDTYEAVAARMFGAEVSTIAGSGKGVVRNYSDMLFTMPTLYPQTLANPAVPLWDFHIEPQAVVINLGTNDISNGKGDPGDAFRDTYAQLLATIRTNYPDAWIIGIIGPLLSDGDLTTIQGHIKDAVAIRTAAGDQKVEAFNMIQPQTMATWACQAHPNAAENMLMAMQLAGELSAKLGW